MGGGIGPWQARPHSQSAPTKLPRSIAAGAFWKHGNQNGKASPISSTPSSSTPSSSSPASSSPPGPPPLPPEAAPAAAEAAAAAQQASKVAAIEGGASPEAAKSAAWWSKLSNQWGQQVKKMGVDLNKAKANIKAPSGLGRVKLDVDVMNPAINSVKANYMQLPEPVRQAAPVVTVMLVLAGFTRYVHRDEMRRAEERQHELERDLQRVKARRDELEAEVTDLSSRIKRANQNLSIEMADALGKAAQAAATATAAAATAATACAYPGQPHQQGPWLEPPKRQRRKILQSVESLRNLDGSNGGEEGGNMRGMDGGRSRGGAGGSSRPGGSRSEGGTNDNDARRAAGVQLEHESSSLDAGRGRG